MTDETRYPRVADSLADVAALREENRRLREALRDLSGAVMWGVADSHVDNLKSRGLDTQAKNMKAAIQMALEIAMMLDSQEAAARQAAALLKPPAAARSG